MTEDEGRKGISSELQKLQQHPFHQARSAVDPDGEFIFPPSAMLSLPPRLLPLSLVSSSAGNSREALAPLGAGTVKIKTPPRLTSFQFENN